MTRKELKVIPERVPGTKDFWFNSMGRFIEVINARNSKGDWNHVVNDESWTGETFDQALKTANAGGRLDQVKDAENLLLKLSADLPDQKQVWTSDMAGDYVVVPDYVAGIPEHFRRKVWDESRNVPIRVFYGIVCSAGISWENMMKRGTTILALAMKLAEERPLEFWVYAGLGGRYSHYGQNDEPGDIHIMTRINTTPLAMAEATYMLTSQGFNRGLNYTFGYEFGFDGEWPKTFNRSNPLDTTAIRKVLKANDWDVVIPAAYLSDEPIYTKPLEWLNEKLAECRKIDQR